MATRFLPNHKQRGIFAIYSLCRYIDDLVDEAEDAVSQNKLDTREVCRKLSDWKRRLREAYEGRSLENPILVAFSDVLRNYEIPIELPFQLMEGVSSDLYKDRYRSFGELYSYSYKVASIVGLMTSEVFGYSSQKALKHAEELGIAMQLTNILRDIGEDLKRGRIYIPGEDLERFGVSEKDFFEGKLNSNFISLLKFQIQRARDYYKRSEAGIPMLAYDSQLPVYLARHNYSRILDKIEKQDFNVFEQRVYLNSTEKLFVLPRIFYRMKFASS